MGIIDTHTHYDDEAFDADRDELIESLYQSGIESIVNAGSTASSLKKVIELTAKWDNMYGALGIHPDEANDLTAELYEEIREELNNPKIVAVGEIGLDYHWMVCPKELQAQKLVMQLELARESDKPVIIHSRDAAADTFSLLDENANGLTGIIHCYAYSVEMAKEYVKKGFLLGIGGVVTFPNAKKLKEVVKEIPLSSLVLETDCPYLAPVPYRGKRNNSAYLTYVADEIAKIKGFERAEVIEKTTENAKRLFAIQNGELSWK